MISLQYRNAKILFEDHSNVIDSVESDEFDLVCQTLDNYMRNMENSYAKGLYHKDRCFFVRLCPQGDFMVYIGLELNHNPYIFLHDRKNNTISSEIPFNIFKKIGDSPYIYMMEDYIKVLNNESSPIGFSEDDFKRFRDEALEYDKSFIKCDSCNKNEQITSNTDNLSAFDEIDATVLKEVDVVKKVTVSRSSSSLSHKENTQQHPKI